MVPNSPQGIIAETGEKSKGALAPFQRYYLTLPVFSAYLRAVLIFVACIRRSLPV